MQLQAGGRLTRVVLEDELEELEAQVRAFHADVKEAGEPGELVVEGLLFVWAGPVGHPETTRYVSAHGQGTTTIDLAYNPYNRLVAPLLKKQPQLPEDAASVIAIRPSRLVDQLPLDEVRRRPRCNGAARRRVGSRP